MIFGIFQSQALKNYSFENLPDKLEKPILIYMKTDWCSICKIQKHQIEKDSELKNLLDEKIYLIIFNPEKNKESINYFGKTYNYISNGNSGINELAIELSSNKNPIYPTWILINTDGKILLQQEGLIDNEALKSFIRISMKL